MSGEAESGGGDLNAASPSYGDRRQRAREPLFNLPRVVTTLILLMAAVHLVRTQFLNAEQDFSVLVHAAFIPIFYSGAFNFDVWSFTAPFTYTLLHGDWLHFGVNAVWLAAFGSPLANRLGWPRFLAFWAAAGLAAVALHFAIYPSSEAPLIGASGAISGMMGAAARFGFRTERTEKGAVFSGPPLTVPESLRSRGVLVFLVIWMTVNALTGLAGAVPGVSGQIAWEAHVGGFVAGFLGIGLFLRGITRRA